MPSSSPFPLFARPSPLIPPPFCSLLPLLVFPCPSSSVRSFRPFCSLSPSPSSLGSSNGKRAPPKEKKEEGGREASITERRRGEEGEANGHGGHRVICLLQEDTPGSPFRRSLGGSACLRRRWRLSPSPTRLRRGRRRFPFRPSFVVWSCLSWNSDIFMREEMSLSLFPSASPRGSFSSPAAVLPEKRGRKKREAPFFPSPLFSRL